MATIVDAGFLWHEPAVFISLRFQDGKARSIRDAERASRLSARGEMHKHRRIVSAFLVFGVAGCTTPYNLSLDNFDESGPQAAASIEISDPQIYTRENLINDRRKEIARLNELLAGSKSAKFVPQLRRDLREISAFTASLRASFNPAAGAAAGRAEEEAALQHEIALANLRADLAGAQERQLLAERRTEDVRSGNTPEGQPPAASGQGAPQAVAPPTLPALGDIQTRLDGLSTKLNDVLANAPKAAATDIPSTPQEQFRDEQAYRAEIRAAIAESNLDDLHDAAGNALYRLQFRATVLPGERKGQYGVSRLRIMPPSLTVEEIRDLYFAWLGHVTYQLNLPVGNGAVANWRYETLGAASNDLYNIVYLALPNEEEGTNCSKINLHPSAADDCVILRLAVIPPFGVGVQELLDSALNLPSFNGDLEQLSLAADPIYAALKSGRLQPDETEEACIHPYLSGMIENWFARARPSRPMGQIIVDVQRLHRFLPVLASSIRSLQNAVPHMGPNATRAVSRLLSALNLLVVNAQGVLSPLTQAFPGCKEFDPEHLRTALREDIPPSFLLPLVGTSDLQSGSTYPPSSDYRTYTYSAKPVELAQQISTAASAGNALELSLALAGTVPNSGVSAEGSAGYMRAAVGRMEALERAPIVVGFATAESTGKQDGSTEFGWVFGPAVVPDTEDNKLRRVQRVVNHQVFADVSVPGWWPRMQLNIETAWIANWHDGAKGILHREEKNRDRTIAVKLPLNRASLEDLTDVVAKPIWGEQPGTAQIYDVQPKSVYLCPEQKVQFLVLGSNIWRNTSVFLNGTEADADTVKVLPDMAGVTATIDLAKVTPTETESTGSVLTVWTQNGSDSFSDIHLMKPPAPDVCRQAAKPKPDGSPKS